jgi:two-component system, OmpR family, heavy metal sensor histidine kinase CusS
VVCSLVAVHVGLRVSLYRETDQRLREDLLEIEMTIREFYPNWELIHEELDRKAIGHGQHRMFVQLYAPTRQLEWSSITTPAAFDSDPAPLDDRDFLTIGEFRLGLRTVHTPIVPAYTVVVGTSLAGIDADVRRLTQTMLLVGGAILILSPLGGFWLAARATRPFGAINRTAERLQPHRLEMRLPIRGTGDELDRLSTTINRLLDRLAAYLQQNRLFIANAAHELRTPLTAIQSSLEVALAADRTVEEYTDLLEEITEERPHLPSVRYVCMDPFSRMPVGRPPAKPPTRRRPPATPSTPPAALPFMKQGPISRRPRHPISRSASAQPRSGRLMDRVR